MPRATNLCAVKNPGYGRDQARRPAAAFRSCPVSLVRGPGFLPAGRCRRPRRSSRSRSAGWSGAPCRSTKPGESHEDDRVAADPALDQRTVAQSPAMGAQDSGRWGFRPPVRGSRIGHPQGGRTGADGRPAIRKDRRADGRESREENGLSTTCPDTSRRLLSSVCSASRAACTTRRPKLVGFLARRREGKFPPRYG